MQIFNPPSIKSETLGVESTIMYFYTFSPVIKLHTEVWQHCHHCWLSWRTKMHVDILWDKEMNNRQKAVRDVIHLNFRKAFNTFPNFSYNSNIGKKIIIPQRLDE